MKKIIYLIAFLPLLVFAQAAETQKLTTTEFTIKNGHADHFKEGVKLWKECYMANKGTWKWNLWQRQNGQGTSFVVASMQKNWAEMDQADEAGKKCRNISLEKITPHVESTNKMISTTMPEVSRESDPATKLIWVGFFKVNNSTEFNEVIKEMNSMVKTVEGKTRNQWYAVAGGGPDDADYFAVTPYANYAALDIKRDGVWKMYETKHGKEKSDALRARFRASIDENWAYIYKLNDELSNQ
jgi:hypothetical protein